MPAKNKKQQKLFGMALAYERGKMSKGKASKKVKSISKGMSEEEIEKFAKTKHKGLKENRALNFRDFLNEAHIDAEGRLQDLEFDLDDRYALAAQDEINKITDFLEDSGATRATGETNGLDFNIYFTYNGSQYMIKILTNSDEVLLLDGDDPDAYQIFKGSTDEFFTILQYNGLDYFLL